MERDLANLSLTVIEADLTRDTETFGKMDPFIKFKYNELEFSTTEKSNAGKKPIWNETFQINVKNLEDNLHLAVMDADPMSDDLIGEATIIFS